MRYRCGGQIGIHAKAEMTGTVEDEDPRGVRAEMLFDSVPTAWFRISIRPSDTMQIPLALETPALRACHTDPTPGTIAPRRIAMSLAFATAVRLTPTAKHHHDGWHGLDGRRRRADLAPDTIRYYERLGLMPRAPRSAGRHRYFGPSHVQRLLFIRRARAVGFSLDAIGSLLSLAAPGRRSCASARKLAMGHLDDVRARLAELQRLEAALAETHDA